MNRQIILRKYEKNDHDALSDIIRRTWNYDSFCSPKTAKALAGIYLDNCLANQTYTNVAIVDGTPAGIIMGKNIRTHKTSLRFRLRLLCSLIPFLLSKEGRESAHFFKDINQIDEALLKDSGKNYQGEVAFFAVSPEYRGMELGKMLFQSLQQYMKQEEINDFFLFTDTTCNYPFYERQGLKRRGEKSYSFQAEGKKQEMTFFIYDSISSRVG